MKMRPKNVILTAAFAVLSFAGCNSPQSTSERSAPKPQHVVAKTDGGISCTFLKWDAGLRLIVADACGDGGWRGTLVDDYPGQPFVWCGTLNNPKNAEYVLKWTIKTLDGIVGTFDINGETYDLNKGQVFFLEPTADGISIKQLASDSGGIELTEEALKAFATQHLETDTPELKQRPSE